MCHILLFMPAIAIPVFWLAPLDVAMPIYGIVALTSGVLYWLIMRSMRQAPLIGAESLVGAEAEVVSKVTPGSAAQYLVQSQGELWSARSTDVLELGETVRVVALRGISLIVERRNSSSQLGETPQVEGVLTGLRPVDNDATSAIITCHEDKEHIPDTATERH